MHHSKVGIEVARPVIAKPFLVPAFSERRKPIAESTIPTAEPMMYSGARNQEKIKEVAAIVMPIIPPVIPSAFSLFEVDMFPFCRKEFPPA